MMLNSSVIKKQTVTHKYQTKYKHLTHSVGALQIIILLRDKLMTEKILGSGK